MHKQRMVVLICALLGMLGTFLPWVELPVFGSVRGTFTHGWLTLCLYAAAVSVALKGPSHDDISGAAFLGAAIPALIASAIGIWDIVGIKSGSNSGGGDPFAAAFGSMMQVGYGLYIVAAAGIVIAVAGKVMMESAVADRVQIQFDAPPQSAPPQSAPAMRADATMPERETVRAGDPHDR